MIIDGKALQNEILDQLKQKIESFKGKRAPKLAYLLIGNNPASHLYVKFKVRACQRVGIETLELLLPDTIEESEVLKQIDALNQDPSVDGILVQLPLPPQVSTQKVIERVDPKKDVDGFHPLNIGRLLLGYSPDFVSCTPLGILEIFKRTHIPLTGKHVVVLGRSNIVGKPLAALLAQKTKFGNATVTLAHSYTENLVDITTQADILIVAMGSPEFVKGSMVKNGAVVIDVGISKHQGRVVGDVLFEEVDPKASYITPVPGGVGPMTVAMLLSNTVLSYERREQLA